MKEIKKSKTHDVSLSPAYTTGATETKVTSSPHYVGHRQRQYEKLLDGDPSSFHDYEVLELLLFYLYPRQDVKHMAKALLADVSHIGQLIHAHSDQYTAISTKTGKAIGHSHHPVSQFLKNTRRRAFFALIAEVARRISIETLHEKRVPITTIDQLIHYLRSTIGHKTDEHVTILYLNKNNYLIKQTTQKNKGNKTSSRTTLTHQTISQHDPYAVNVSTHALLRQAILLNASAIILAHNHPGGKALPSTQDIKMTRDIYAKLRTINVALHDHIIITPYASFSMKEHGLF